MTDWVRLWHDMPTDPKWRVIARKSGQKIAVVISVFNFILVNASANATERGRTHNLNAEDIAAALDMDEADIDAVLLAMEGKVLDGDRLMGWEKRQPKREDSSAERAKEWRERNRTQPTAEKRSDADAETDKNTIANAMDVPSDPIKVFFDSGLALFAELNPAVTEKAIRSLLGKLRQKFPEIADAQDALDVMATRRPVDPVSWLMAFSRSELPPSRQLADGEPLDPEFYQIAAERESQDVHEDWEGFRNWHVAKGIRFRSMAAEARRWFDKQAEFRRSKIYAVK